MEKVFGLVEVMLLSGGSCETMHLACSGINADLGFHSEVPVIAFLGLVHFRVTLTSFVLGRNWCLDYRCIRRLPLEMYKSKLVISDIITQRFISDEVNTMVWRPHISRSQKNFRKRMKSSSESPLIWHWKTWPLRICWL